MSGRSRGEGKGRAPAGRLLEAAASSSLSRPCLRWMSTWRHRQSFAVLKYHRVGAPDDEFFPGIAEDHFVDQMRHLASTWNVLPVTELVRRAESGTLPPLAAGITFDDNYASVHDIGWPILRSLGLSAMVFTPTGPLLDGAPLWYDRVLHAFKHAAVARLENTGIAGLDGTALGDPAQRYCLAEAALAELRPLDEASRRAAVVRIEAVLRARAWATEPAHAAGSLDQMRRHLEEGLEIGAHSVSHPIFSCLEPARVRQELRESRDQLEEWLQVAADIFAYPNGRAEDYDRVTLRELEAAGYRAAFTTTSGLNHGDWKTSRYRLVRNDGMGTSARRLLLRLASLTLAA